jgi:hypothetical protein
MNDRNIFYTVRRCAVMTILFYNYEFGEVGRKARDADFSRQLVLDGVGQYEIAVSQSLHQCGCVGAVEKLASPAAWKAGFSSPHGRYLRKKEPSRGGEDGVEK